MRRAVDPGLFAEQAGDGGPEAGFTLIEMIAALAILAISLTIIFQVIGAGVSRGGQAEMLGRARQIAQSALARVGTEIPLKAGDTEGEETGGFRWHLRQAPHGDAADRRAWPVAVLEITAEVSWGGSGSGNGIKLTTLRAAAKRGAP